MNDDDIKKAYNAIIARKGKMEPNDIIGQLQRMLLFTFYDAEKTSKAELANLLKNFLRLKKGKPTNLFSDGSALAQMKIMRDNANYFNNLLNEVLIDITQEYLDSEKEPDEYIRSYVLAKRLNVSKGTVTNWIKKGYINNVKREGRKIDIPITEVEKFIRYFPKYRPFWEQDFRM